jgi:hypothetical protein
MSKFVKVKYNDCRYTQKGGHDMWLNIDTVVAFDEQTNFVHTTSGQVFPISEESSPTLIEALKGGE